MVTEGLIFWTSFAQRNLITKEGTLTGLGHKAAADKNYEAPKQTLGFTYRAMRTEFVQQTAFRNLKEGPLLACKVALSILRTH